MKLRIDHDNALMSEELRLRDPDAYVILELCRWQHGEGAFDLADDARASIPLGDWSPRRFADARSRLIKAGYLAVSRS